MLKSKSNTVVIYKTMKIVICDDEAVFVNVIESQLRNYAAKIDLNIEITKCRSARELLSLDLLGCDVLFLDIDMPEINGITAARPLRTVFAYGALTLFRWPSQTILLTVLSLDVCPNPKDIATFGLASSAFARHY